MAPRMLDFLLRSLRGGEGSALGATPAPRVAPAARAHPVADARILNVPWPIEARPDAPLTPSQGPATPAHATAPTRVPARRDNGAHDLHSAKPQAKPATQPTPPQPVPVPARPPPISGAVAPSISATAKWVSELMQEPAGTGPHTPIVPAAPLLSAPPAASEPLAVALRESIARSGLFYESHLADWALQRCTRDDLVREPQANWPADVRLALDDAPSQAPPETIVVEARDVMSHEPVSVHVRMQLTALETGQVRWAGEAWPRQPAFIEIDCDSRAANESEVEVPVPKRSRTKLRLTMPRLGTVDVDLLLVDEALRVAVRAESAAGAKRLQSAQPQLVDALAARFAESAVTVEHAQGR